MQKAFPEAEFVVFPKFAYLYEYALSFSTGARRSHRPLFSDRQIGNICEAKDRIPGGEKDGADDGAYADICHEGLEAAAFSG